jgi:AcrR family transcriptional regulator
MTHAVAQEPARQDTKTRILDAAERLFAEQGFAATSLRQITRVAKANLAAVNYHFQSKDSLVEAVLRRKIGWINDRRLELLDAEEGAGGPVTLEGVFRTFFQPLFEAEQQGVDLASFPRLLSRVYGDEQESMMPLFRSAFGGVIARYRAAFHRAAPGLGQRAMALAFHFSIGSMAHYLAAGKMLELLSGGSGAYSREEVVEQLVRFCAGGVKAMGEGEAGR